MSKKKAPIRYYEDDPSLFLAPNTIKSCIFAWLFPGAGHFFLGRTKSAIILCSALVVSYILGIAMGGDLYPFRGEGTIRSLGALCQMGIGVPFLFGKAFLERGVALNPTYDYGTIYFLIAGMLNWLAVIDTFDIAVGRK